MLELLSGCLLRIAIVTGRDAEQVAAAIPVRRLTVVGNHGLEEHDGRQSRVLAAARPYVAAIERAAGDVARLESVRQPGVAVERKRATLSVHFRNAADPRAAESALAGSLRAVAEREGLVLRPGRLVWELRPPLAIDKGEVLRRLAGSLHPDAVIYAGDDVTDADAFRSLATLSSRIRTLAVGVRSAEVPEDTFAAVDLLFDGVPGVKRLLGELLALCRTSGAAPSR